MDAYVIGTNTRIEPFDEPVSESLIAGRPLTEWQEEAMRFHSLTVHRVAAPAEIPPGECLVTWDYVFVSEKALGDFLKARRRRKQGPAALALPKNISSQYTQPMQDTAEAVVDGKDSFIYDLFITPPDTDLRQKTSAEAREQLLRSCPPLLTPMREISLPFRLPTLGNNEQILRFPITSSICAHVRAWPHILWLNHLSWGMRWMETFRRHKIWTFWKALLGLTLFILSTIWNFIWRGRPNWDVATPMAHLNRWGKGCKVHPTACVEGSFIGDGVQIGARALVRNCCVGDRAVIGDHAAAITSVLGKDVFITEDTVVVMDAIYPGATVGNLKLQVSIIGRNSFLHGWAAFIDAKFLGGVSITQDGKRLDTGRSFLGSAVGHDCILAAKVLIHPGRGLPNKTFMVMRPDECIFDVPTDLPKGVPLIREQGSLRVFREAIRGPKGEG